jgi:hypothetical protein
MPTPKEKDIELEHTALTKENRRIRTTLFGIYLRAYAEPEITRFSKVLRELLKKISILKTRSASITQPPRLPIRTRF